MNIYQVLPRLFGNRAGKNVKCGTLAENGCGKMNDFTDEVLGRIKETGYTHIWYTGLLEHATKTSYADFGIAEDNPVVVKGAAERSHISFAFIQYYNPRTVTSREILTIIPWSALPGPHSTNSVAPAAIMFCTSFVQSTLAVSC